MPEIEGCVPLADGLQRLVAVVIWRAQLLEPWFEPIVIGYNAAISVCEKVQRWEHAINLRQEIWRFQLKPDVIGYKAAISACENVQR